MTDKPQCPELAQFLAQHFAPEFQEKPKPKTTYPELWKPTFKGEEPPF